MSDLFKINLEKLQEFENENCYKYFGNWINNIDDLSNQFINAKPYGNIIIPNFLNNEYAELLYSQFKNENLENNKIWHKYCNPIEVKYANDNIETFEKDIKNLFYILSTKEITKIFSKISNIPNLEYDPYLHGAGLHVHPKNGRLNMHLDYEKHPTTGKERRLNLILYLSKNWDPSWNGETQLWDEKMENCIVKSPVIFNTAIIFKTNEISWHGLPEKINCPENIYRKSFAYYYVSDLSSQENSDKFGNDGTGYRTKATFLKRPQDPYNEKIEKLYKIRPFRRIDKKDLHEIWPEWSPEL
jgi:Rps23 Pro-64 3,4-dihydroxylase Tpa1-like proline 4-hydroxylase